jgi:succinyl-CoA synthetase beta subunit
MKLHEYQTKRIFAEYGIRIPRGAVAEGPEGFRRAAEELGGKVVLKAQVLVGRRGKGWRNKEGNAPTGLKQYSPKQ